MYLTKTIMENELLGKLSEFLITMKSERLLLCLTSCFPTHTPGNYEVVYSFKTHFVNTISYKHDVSPNNNNLISTTLHVSSFSSFPLSFYYHTIVLSLK